jgi:hypothetical protein
MRGYQRGFWLRQIGGRSPRIEAARRGRQKNAKTTPCKVGRPGTAALALRASGKKNGRSPRPVNPAHRRLNRDSGPGGKVSPATLPEGLRSTQRCHRKAPPIHALSTVRSRSRVRPRPAACMTRSPARATLTAGKRVAQGAVLVHAMPPPFAATNHVAASLGAAKSRATDAQAKVLSSMANLQ